MSDAEEWKRDRFHPDFRLGSLTTITHCFDFICPWSWVGWHHEQRLTQEFGVTFDWRPFELVPPGMDFSPPPPRPADPDAPPQPPGRFDVYAHAEGVPMRSPKPPFVRSHAALLASEFARAQGRFDAFVEAVYRAYWERAEGISNLSVLETLAEGVGIDGAGLTESVRAERFAERIVPFDDPAYAIGIRHIPTFLFGNEEKLAEANYSDLAHATERFLFRAKKLHGGGAK